MPRQLRAPVVVMLGLVTTVCREPSTAPAPITHLPRPLTASETHLVTVSNQFAFTLLREVARQTRDTLPNLFISPLSVTMALGMTYNGAAGTTEAAMRQTLALDPMTTPEVNEAFHGLIDLLRGLDPRVRFQIANSIWYRQGFTVEPAFVDVNRTAYDARVEGLDFGSPAAPQRINDWVSTETQGRITRIVPTPLPSDAVMYLINAIYFKGDWTQQFDRARTRPQPFHLSDGTAVSVPTMSTDKPASILTYRDGTVQVADLHYGGRAFSMMVVMPRDSAALDSLVQGLTAEQWNGWVAGLDSASLDVSLPKFTLTNDLLLNSMLTALGMGIAFDCDPPEMADFTRMHVPQEVCISTVKHKTFVDVNEEGTEAAAATAVGIGFTSVPQPIVVDRPFLFAIRENLSGTILFLGMITNPAQLP
jgi:serine protease inhibitor